MCLRYCHRSIWGPSSTRVSSPSSTSFHVRSFLKETVFILLFNESHNVFLHFDIAKVKTRFTREPLVTTVSLLNLTVACVPEKHRAALNLRSFLHESVFTLLVIEGHNVFRPLRHRPNQNTLHPRTACHDCFFGKSHGGMCP